MTGTGIPMGIAHLTLLGCPPPELVDVAAAAGFDFVGLRVVPATAGEEQYPMSGPGSLLDETLLRLKDTGLYVRDIEFLTLDERVSRERWLPILETAALLGATHLSVVGADPDRARLADSLAALTRDAAPYGLVPTLEPITYQPVHSIPEAADLARAAGCAVLLDSLHVHRFGGTVDELQALERTLVPHVQLCDAPLAEPHDLPRPARLPLGQSTDGSDLKLESRALRALPGEGELPLADFLAAVPEGTPVSVEAPSVFLAEQLGAREFARRARAGADAVLAEAGR
ncbi:sugar phosphate isomerase/epimerase family protein [Streptomyces sp. NPDC050400]|uniref:sugar phosphate isomerase/epimerase family protein n=1 Tax=Streptomyces sp. NPDC050400 TaxID=3365610 RepID=UPI00378C8A6F